MADASQETEPQEEPVAGEPQVETFTAEDLEQETAPAGSADEAAAEPTAEERLATAEDQNLRLQAELQNMRMRASRDLAEERKYGCLPLVRDLLPALDNIDRAIEAAQKGTAEGEGSLLEGFQLVRQQLVTLLEQHGCQEIETEGVAFDPELHEAILQQPSPDHEEGTIVTQVQGGFRLHERVVRAAKVIVSSGG